MERVDRYLCILTCVCLAVFVALAVLTGDASSYEHSFYQYFHPATWVFFVGSVGGSFTLLIRWLSGAGENWWGLVTLIATYAVFFTLPQLLGLSAWLPVSADSLYHISDIRYILETGHAPDNNIYPALHIFVTFLSAITNFSAETLQPITGLTSVIMLAVGTAVFAQRYTGDHQIGIAAGIMCLALVFGKYEHNLMPWFFTFALISLTLACVVCYHQSRQKKSKRWLLLILLVFIPILSIGHPMTTVVFGIAAVVYVITNQAITGEYQLRQTIYWLSIVPIIWYAWFFQFPGIQDKIQYTIMSLILYRTGGAQKAIEASDTSYTLIQLFQEYILERWGAGLFLIALGGVAAVIVGTVLLQRRRQGNPVGKHLTQMYFFGVVLYLAGLIMAVGFLAIDAVTGAPVRINQITILASLLLVAIALGTIGRDQFQDLPLTRVASTCLAASILILSVYAPFVMYSESNHLRQSEIEGIEWHLDTRNEEIPTLSQRSTHKMSEYAIGYEKASKLHYNDWAFSRENSSLHLPRQFGYESNQSLAVSLNRSQSYVVVAERNLEWWRDEPRNRWPNIQIVTRQMTDRVNTDPTANRIYSNERYTVWVAG